MDLKETAQNYISEYLEPLKWKIKIIAGCVCAVLLLLVSILAGGGSEDSSTTYNTSGMSPASGSSWEQFVKFLHSWESGGNAPTAQNDKGEKCYIVTGDGDGGLAVGYGIDSCHANELKDKNGNSYSFKEGDLIPIEIVDAFEEKELNDCKRRIQEKFKVAGVDYTEYQLYALLSLTYNCGPGIVDSFFGGMGMGQAYGKYYTVNNNDYYGKKDKFDENLNFFTQKFMEYNSGGLLTGRRRSEVCLFETGYYGYDLSFNGHGMDEYWQAVYFAGNPGTIGSTIIEGTTIATYTSSKGRVYPLFKQSEGPWASRPYGSYGTVKESGCTTTAVSTVLMGLGITCTPNDFLNIPTRGTGNAITDKGLKVKKYDNDNNSLPSITECQAIVKSCLLDGNPIVIFEKSPNSIFTTTKHWMALLDVSQDGSKVFVASGYSIKEAGWYDINTALQGLDLMYCITK